MTLAYASIFYTHTHIHTHTQVNKKRFIGNTYVKVVYSDSAHPFTLSSLSGQVESLKIKGALIQMSQTVFVCVCQPVALLHELRVSNIGSVCNVICVVRAHTYVCG